MQSLEPFRALPEADVSESFVRFYIVLVPQCSKKLMVRVVSGEAAADYFWRWLEMSFVEPGRLTRLWNLWEREIGMLEFKVEEKVDVYEWICGRAREWAKAMCLSTDEKRSQELSGEVIEPVGSSDYGHEEEVPEAELRTNREAAEEWKEPPMPGGKMVACESEA